MKNLASIFVALLVYVPVVTAQKVTIRFEGLANANNSTAQNYIADVDGRKYYSSDGESTPNSAAKQIDITNLSTGSHKITVYEATSNSSVSTNNALYSNNFQLRSGYDMVIAVRKNGQVSFSEKKMKETSSAVAKAPMTDADFQKQLKTVNANWSQTSKYNTVKSAFSNKAYYFTTDQVGQLLMPITSEAKRLELAKLSYPKVTDPENFADVSDLFKTQSNKDNIDAFIKSKNSEIAATTGINSARPPISTQQFNQLQRKIKNQYQESGKIAVLKDALTVNKYYYTTAQLKQLLLLIPTETERLTLAKQSYARVSDETNFASLYTIFNTQANRDDFNAYVRYGGTVSSTTTVTSRPAMSDGDFTKLQLKARLHFRQSSTVAEIKTALDNTNNYFSVDQIRSLLSLVSAEADRLTLAKLAYGKTVDPANFTSLYDLFTSQNSITELNNYIKSISLR
jgi:Domain of unknown function (DUF4476)